MNTKRFSFSAVLTAIILAVAVSVSLTMVFAIRHFNQQVSAVTQKQALYTHINDIDTKVRSYYASLDENQLQAAVAEGYVTGLQDPYAAYLTPEEYRLAKLKLQGQSSAVGITLKAEKDGNLSVASVDKDSAADKAGIKSGDILLSVDGKALSTTDLLKLQQQFNTSDSKILLSVKRDDKTLAFEVTAYAYATASVSERMLGETVGYIRITGFYDNTAAQFKAAYSALQNQGATAFVFDLRNCKNGGSRTALEGVLSHLLPHGAYAVYTAADGTVTNMVANTANQSSATTVTLVNGNTAGEAEVFAGVLQEFGMTTVVGDKTAGKGKVQDFVPLRADNSALWLTFGEISLISGGAIEGVGITPDTTVLMEAAKTNLIGQLKDSEDAQLQTAMNTLQSKLSGNLNNGTTTAATVVPDTAGTTATTTAAN